MSLFAAHEFSIVFMNLKSLIKRRMTGILCEVSASIKITCVRSQMSLQLIGACESLAAEQEVT